MSSSKNRKIGNSSPAQTQTSSSISNYFRKKDINTNTNTMEDTNSQIIDLTQTTPTIDTTAAAAKTSTQIGGFGADKDRKDFTVNLPYVSPIREQHPVKESRSVGVGGLKRKKEIVDDKKPSTPVLKSSSSTLKSFQFNKQNKFKKHFAETTTKIEPSSQDLINDTITVIDDDDDFEADFKKPKHAIKPTQSGEQLKCMSCGESFTSSSNSYPFPAENFAQIPRIVTRITNVQLKVFNDDSIVSSLNLKQLEDDSSINSFFDDTSGLCWQLYTCRSCSKLVAIVLRCSNYSDSKFFQMFVNKYLFLTTE